MRYTDSQPWMIPAISSHLNHPIAAAVGKLLIRVVPTHPAIDCLTNLLANDTQDHISQLGLPDSLLAYSHVSLHLEVPCTVLRQGPFAYGH